MTFEKSHFDMKFLSLGHYCMYTITITVGSHSLSQIGMDNNNGQITDFWVSRASKRLNMSTSIKIWIWIPTTFVWIWILTTFVWIPKYTYYIHLDPKIWQTLSFSCHTQLCCDCKCQQQQSSMNL